MINFLACDQYILPIVKFVKFGIFPIVQIGIPIILVVLGTLDLGKAVIAGKEDEMKNAQKMLIKRLVYGVVIFFVVTIVQVVFNLVGVSMTENEDGAICWACVTRPNGGDCPANGQLDD